MAKKSLMFLFFVLIILLIQSVSAISNVQHSVDSNKVTITYEGTPPFWINIRGDETIGQPGGYLWAKTYSNSFSYDMSFANNPSKKFYYGVKDTSWSSTNSFTLQTNSICKNSDYYCPWECNDWKLDSDCGVPKIYNFVESRSPNDYLTSKIIHWDDTSWRTYQPLIQKVNELTNGISDDFEKAKRIADWVKKSRPYGEPSPANQGKSVIDIFNSNTGVCMDAGILTTAMFRIANIPSRAILYGNHEYTEAYINGRWIGFDATFDCTMGSDENCVGGETLIIDPITSIDYNNEFYWNEPKFMSIFSDGTPREVINISYYKVNMIQRNIYKSGEANIKISWGLSRQEQVKEKYCILSSFKTGLSERFSNSPILKTISNEDNSYSLNCVVVLESDPYTEHNEMITITFTGAQIETNSIISNGYVRIDVETIGIKNEVASWGTVYIPTTSATVFKNIDGYSLTYDKSKYTDFTAIRWVIKSDNLNCDYYHCNYVNSNGYSTHISPTGILGYGTIKDFGTRNMPPEHYNGFSQISLPEGKYKLIYSLEGDVGYKYFEILSDQKQVIYPGQISEYNYSTQNKFAILKTTLTKSIEGLNP